VQTIQNYPRFISLAMKKRPDNISTERYRNDHNISFLPSGKFNTYCAFTFQVKLVPCETWQQVAFPDAWITDQHNCNDKYIQSVIHIALTLHKVSITTLLLSQIMTWTRSF